MNAQEMETKIKEQLAGSEVVVYSEDNVHFEARIVSEEFQGKNRVQRHQMVYRALGEAMKEEVHALAIKTLTPEEFNKQ